MKVEYTHKERTVKYVPPGKKRARKVIVEPRGLQAWLTRVMGVKSDFVVDRDFILNLDKRPKLIPSFLSHFSKASDLRKQLVNPHLLFDPQGYIETIESKVRNILEPQEAVLRAKRETSPEEFEDIINDTAEIIVHGESPKHT